ncbi:MAG: hypothetical protein PF513_07195 [Tenericutes bacterium]|nr:hypothetical protein [Mycoplasmatota bacterium]
MLRNRVVAIIVSFINLIIILVLIAYVLDNPFVEILLGVYVIAFSSMMSFLSRRRD